MEDLNNYVYKQYTTIPKPRTANTFSFSTNQTYDCLFNNKLSYSKVKTNYKEKKTTVEMSKKCLYYIAENKVLF